MPDNTNTTTDEPVAEPVDTPHEAETEETAPVEEPTTDQVEAPPEEEPSEIDIDEYWKERYPAPTQSDGQNMADEVAQELSQLPTDESGTVDTKAAAEWFANRLSQVESRASQNVSAQAERAAMAIVSETAQQNQLLKKYPEITQDRETLDVIFDLRDAAALRGQKLSLVGAAAKLDKLRQQGKAEGTESATKRTTVQAAAHLETSSVKGSNQGESDRLVAQAYQGSGQEAIDARRELLKQFVQKGVSEGRIQHP